jgi:protein TonB
VLTVTIKSDGTVDKVEVNRSSGHKILDDAARRIVAMAGPYAVFPPDIRRDTDILEITRSWSFTSRDSLETKAR